MMMMRRSNTSHAAVFYRYYHWMVMMMLVWLIFSTVSFHLYVNIIPQCVVIVQAQQQQNPLTMNGGSVLAMAGKNCVVLAVDKRFGSGRSLINVRKRPVLPLCDTSSSSNNNNKAIISGGCCPTMVAFTGMEGDVQSLYMELYAQIMDKYYRGLGFGERRHTTGGDDGDSSGGRNHFSGSVDVDNHGSDDESSTESIAVQVLSVTAVAMVTSHILYRRKRAPYYVEPIIVGLIPNGWEEIEDDDNDVSAEERNESDVTATKKISEETTSSKKAATAGTRNRIDITATASQQTDDVVPDDFVTITSDATTCGHPIFQRHRRQRLYRPYLCSMDMIGAKSDSSESFVCAGTASQSLYGTAEQGWIPNQSPDDLVAICIRAFMSALERDCLSGYGATVYLLTPDGITEYDISGRSD